MAAAGNSNPDMATMDISAFNRILQFGVDRGISDVHFEVAHPPHLRLQGDLLPAKYVPLRPRDTRAIAELLLGEAYAAFVADRKERDVTYAIEGISRFRATVFWQRGYVGIVLRVIPLTIRSFGELNLPSCLEDLCLTRRGLILVTGATGMGKSTTIAAMLQRINQTRRAHIITIEEPIEFLFPKEKSLIIQREVGTDTETYRAAILAALRQDPDVIMLGEARDTETIDTCIKAAETGHLVLTSVHTEDALRTIQRIVGMFPPADHETIRLRLAESLKAVICLRLLPALDGKMRLPAVEIMRVTRTIAECIRNPAKIQEIPQHIAKGQELYGMQTFDQHLHAMLQDQRVSMEVARMAASNPDDLQRHLTLEEI